MKEEKIEEVILEKDIDKIINSEFNFECVNCQIIICDKEHCTKFV